MQNELERLKESFTEDEIKDSWFCTFLQNKINNTQKSSNRVVMKIEAKDENELKKLKLNLLNQGLKFAKPEKKEEWLKFAETNLNNPYYLNIIEITLYIIEYKKAFNDADVLSILKNINLSGIQMVFLKNIITQFFDETFSLDDYKVEHKPNLF